VSLLWGMWGVMCHAPPHVAMPLLPLPLRTHRSTSASISSGIMRCGLPWLSVATAVLQQQQQQQYMTSLAAAAPCAAVLLSYPADRRHILLRYPQPPAAACVPPLALVPSLHQITEYLDPIISCKTAFPKKPSGHSVFLDSFLQGRAPHLTGQ
jgi:hypothetical protein